MVEVDVEEGVGPEVDVDVGCLCVDSAGACVGCVAGAKVAVVGGRA